MRPVGLALDTCLRGNTLGDRGEPGGLLNGEGGGVFGGVLMLRRSLIVPVLFVLVAAGCSQDEAVVDDAIDAPSTSTTAATTTTTSAVVQTTGTVAAPSDEVTITDVVYLEMDGHEYLVDVYIPAGEGPWPVVVAFSGETLDKEHVTNVLVARAAAEAGMLVFVPNLVEEWPKEPDEYIDAVKSIEPVYRCAMAFAQQEAAAYRGDPNRTVTYGFSAGVHPSVLLALGPEAEPTPGCLAQTPQMRPVGAVLGEGQYFQHDVMWDGAFDADPEWMQAYAATMIDPTSWPADVSTRFRFWAADLATYPRMFDDPWDEDGWLNERDPDGTIRQDLDELGELDDGIIAMSDEGLLLTTRLQQAGIDATIDMLPGPHNTIDKVPAIVALLLDAAGTG